VPASKPACRLFLKKSRRFIFPPDDVNTSVSDY